LALAGPGAVDGWALSHMTGIAAGAAALAGVAGAVTFAAALSPKLATRRHRSMATGLVLIGAAVVTSAIGQPAGQRNGFLVVSGAVLFCAAETADRALDRPRASEARPGVDRFAMTSVLAVAAGAGALSYLAISVRGAFAGGGPAALAAGTVAAILVAVLATVVLRTGVGDGP
jgi:hypothetical protein